ncbi:MAG: FHA domain-containing protein [Microbacteriaceae bacterium]|nr:FHA domain-containing protein [Microbacteriaceae bacterium]MCI1206888.1 FHA domain-containing protein [Microbacteriaceae bacterium]
MRSNHGQDPTQQTPPETEADAGGLRSLFGSVDERIEAVLHPTDPEVQATAWHALAEDERQQVLRRWNHEHALAEEAQPAPPAHPIRVSDESAAPVEPGELAESSGSEASATSVSEPSEELPASPAPAADAPRSLPGIALTMSTSLPLPPLGPASGTEPIAGAIGESAERSAAPGPTVDEASEAREPVRPAVPSPVSDKTTVTPTIRPGQFPEGWHPQEQSGPAAPAVRLADLVFAQGTRVELVATRVLLGRNPSTDDPAVQVLRIPDGGRAVSRNHALLELVEGRWYITDLRSTNGTRAVMGDHDVLLPAGRQVEVRGAFRIGGYEAAIEV